VKAIAGVLKISSSNGGSKTLISSSSGGFKNPRQ